MKRTQEGGKFWGITADRQGEGGGGIPWFGEELDGSVQTRYVGGRGWRARQEGCGSPRLLWWQLGASGYRNPRKDEATDGQTAARRGRELLVQPALVCAVSASPRSSDRGFPEFSQQVTVASTGRLGRAGLLGF